MVTCKYVDGTENDSETRIKHYFGMKLKDQKELGKLQKSANLLCSTMMDK